MILFIGLKFWYSCDERLFYAEFQLLSVFSEHIPSNGDHTGQLLPAWSTILD